MAALTKPRPVLDTRQPATKPGTWGSQPPHMRLTDVENFARRLPTRATRLTTPETTAPRGTFSAAHLTDVPPYEERGSQCPQKRLIELDRLRTIIDAARSSNGDQQCALLRGCCGVVESAA